MMSTPFFNLFFGQIRSHNKADHLDHILHSSPPELPTTPSSVPATAVRSRGAFTGLPQSSHIHCLRVPFQTVRGSRHSHRACEQWLALVPSEAAFLVCLSFVMMSILSRCAGLPKSGEAERSPSQSYRHTKAQRQTPRRHRLFPRLGISIRVVTASPCYCSNVFDEAEETG